MLGLEAFLENYQKDFAVGGVGCGEEPLGQKVLGRRVGKV
jgi:hypothetical protein